MKLSNNYVPFKISQNQVFQVNARGSHGELIKCVTYVLYNQDGVTLGKVEPCTNIHTSVLLTLPDLTPCNRVTKCELVNAPKEDSYTLILICLIYNNTIYNKVPK